MQKSFEIIMGGLFSKKKEDGPKRKQLGKARQNDEEMSDKDKAKFDLRVAKKAITKLTKQVEADVVKFKEKARQLLKAKKKDRALMCLRMSKFKTKKLAELDNQMFKLESMIMEIKSQAASLEVFNAMKVANSAIKTIQSRMSIDDVEQLMEENEESNAYVQEMSELLGETVSEDDEAILAEMNALEAEELNAALPEAPETSLSDQLPVAPTGVLDTKVAAKVEEKRVMVPA